VNRAAARKGLGIVVVPVLSTLAYFLVRPWAGSDVVALAVSGALPAVWAVVRLVAWKKVDGWALLTAAGYGTACLLTVLTGGSKLPLELPETLVVFGVGVVLLVALAIRRPLPLARLLKVPDRSAEAGLNAVVGAFLVLHSLLQLGLALVLPTGEFLTVGKLISWATIAAGVLCLWLYVKRLRSPAPAAV
jgi:hypothetical protein